MPNSSTNITEIKEINKEKENPLKKCVKKFTSFQDDHIKNEIFKKLNEGTVLNFIRNSNIEKVKSNISIKSQEMKYDLCMINKYDENLNTSLSFISEFDLEEDVKENNSSFESCDNDNSMEQIKIVKNSKNCKRSSIQEDIENEDQLENDWKDIQELLLKKNLS